MTEPATTQQLSLLGGHITILAALPPEWPPAGPQILQDVQVEDGVVQIAATAAGTFRLGVYDRNDEVIAFIESIPINFSGGTSFTLQVQWEGNKAHILFDGTLIGDTSSDALIVHPPKKESPTARYDFSSESADAVRIRSEKLAARVPKSGRIPGGAEHLFEGLRREQAQLMDLVEWVLQGKVHHMVGIATRLRMLVATGDPLPALQSCAAILDLPLTVYTVGSPRHKFPEDLREKMSFSMQRGATAQSDAISYNPVDLDVWLDLKGAMVRAKDLTNRTIIKMVGDTFGAHLDHDVVAEIPVLSSAGWGVGSVPLTSLEMFLGQTAEAAIDLCRRILSAYEEKKASENSLQDK